MENKEKILERFMRDQEHKANSLYNSGYRAGYSDAVRDMQSEEQKPEEDTIKVGDEVIDPNGLRAIVTNTDTHYHLLYPSNGKTWKAPKSTWLKKTGAEFTL